MDDRALAHHHAVPTDAELDAAGAHAEADAAVSPGRAVAAIVAAVVQSEIRDGGVAAGAGRGDDRRDAPSKRTGTRDSGTTAGRGDLSRSSESAGISGEERRGQETGVCGPQHGERDQVTHRTFSVRSGLELWPVGLRPPLVLDMPEHGRFPT